MSKNQRNPTFMERLENGIDKAISVLSPRWGAERRAYRAQMRLAAAYEAVPKWRNSADWVPVDGKGEALNAPNRDMARAKARHLERNSELINSIINAFERNVVGKGFNLQLRTDNQDWNNAIEALWADWSRPGNCDVTGRFCLTEILKLIVRRRIVDGGILALKVTDKSSDIPYRLQLIEVDNLKGPGEIKSPAGNAIIGGIEVNKYGKPLNYYIEQATADITTVAEIETVKADRVFYLSTTSRPSEVREISPLTRALDDVHDLEEFFDAVAFKQKINAAIAVFITTQKDAGSTFGRSLAPKGEKDSNGKPAGTRIDSGSIKYLEPGQDVRSIVPSGQSSELNDYNLAVSRRIGAGHNLSYEMMTRDVSKVNYSSARQNLLEDWKTFADEQNYIIEHFLDFVLEDVVTAAYLAGKLKNAPKDFMTNRQKYLKHEFIGQGLPWIDPLKEAQANQVMLATGQTTLKDIYAKKGKDWEEEVAQLALEREKTKELGLVSEAPVTVKGDDGDGRKSEE